MIGHEVVGAGPEKAIVFHGWSADHTSFAPLYPALDAQAFTFVFMDYRGCGLSKDQRGEYAIEEIGADAIELVDHLQWKRFHAVGHSMGGMVVQWVAANHPDRVKSGVAITPIPACGLPTLDKAMVDWFRTMGDCPENLAKFYMDGTGNRYNPAWARARVLKSGSTVAHDAYEKYALAFIKTNFARQVIGLRLPLKVLVGEYDPGITVEVMQQTILKWFPNAELEVLKNAGHVPMAEIPINLATIIQAFMAGHA